MNPFSNQVPQTKIAILGFIAKEVPASQPLHHRPMTFNPVMDMKAIANVTHGGERVDPLTLQSIASQIVEPSRQSAGVLGINGGWNQTRYAIYIHFGIESNGRYYRELMTAYTDEADSSMGNLMNPNTLIYVNSHIRIHEPSAGISAQNPTGAGSISLGADNVMSNTNILRPITIQQGEYAVQGQYGMRPSDVLTGMQRTLRPEGDNYDFRGQLNDAASGNMGVPSARNHSSSSSYISTILNSVNQARATMATFGNTGNDVQQQAFMVGSAAGAASSEETEYTAMAVFNMLKERTSYGVAGAFTLNELMQCCAYDPNNIKPPIPLERGQSHLITEYTEHLGGTGGVTSIAHKLAHAIPAVASRYTFGALAFTASKTPQGIVVNYENGDLLFPGSEASDYAAVNSIKMALSTVILPEIFNGDCDYFTLKVNYTMSGVVNMEISLDGQNPVPFAPPQYCDSLSASTVTANEQHVMNSGQVIASLVENVMVNAPVQGY